MNVALAISPTERRLRDRIDELEEEVRQYRDLLVPAEILPADWGLEPAQNRLVIALSRAPHGYMTHEQISHAVSVYSTESTTRAIAGIQVHRARKKLASRQITINTRWGTGYEMPQASRNIIKAAHYFLGNSMSGRTISGGVDDRSAAYSANSTRADLTSVLTGRSLIEPYKFTDTLRDRVTLCFVCMVVCSVAVLFGVFLYIGFFFRA